MEVEEVEVEMVADLLDLSVYKASKLASQPASQLLEGCSLVW